jgi:hypothetical protein
MGTRTRTRRRARRKRRSRQEIAPRMPHAQSDFPRARARTGVRAPRGHAFALAPTTADHMTRPVPTVVVHRR